MPETFSVSLRVFVPSCEAFNVRESSSAVDPLILANYAGTWHAVIMPHRPPRAKKPEQKSGEPGDRNSRENQAAEQRRRELATRSTLSRLRNRKSDLK